MLNSHDSLAVDTPFFIWLMILALDSTEYALLVHLLLHIVLYLSNTVVWLIQKW